MHLKKTNILKHYSYIIVTSHNISMMPVFGIQNLFKSSNFTLKSRSADTSFGESGLPEPFPSNNSLTDERPINVNRDIKLFNVNVSI